MALPPYVDAIIDRETHSFPAPKRLKLNDILQSTISEPLHLATVIFPKKIVRVDEAQPSYEEGRYLREAAQYGIDHWDARHTSSAAGDLGFHAKHIYHTFRKKKHERTLLLILADTSLNISAPTDHESFWLGLEGKKDGSVRAFYEKNLALHK